MLPTDIPRPLEVSAGSGHGEPSERNLERGVKVKWPSKRTSVGDMNKRVRALVEWVGREQVGAQDRQRRKAALLQAKSGAPDLAMDIDDQPLQSSGQSSMLLQQPNGTDTETTMTTMEKLMEELLNFQERFGPGVKTRDRDRRTL